METVNQTNTRRGKTLNYKHRTLAMFQFFSFTGIIALLGSAIFIGYSIIMTEPDGSITKLNPWMNHFGRNLIFSSSEVTGILGGLMFYIFIGLWMTANIFGWLMFRFKNRNLFDQLFLVFLMIPIISNIFALFSQLATRKLEYTSANFDKKKIIEEQTRMIKLNFKKAEIEKKKRIASTTVHKDVEKNLEKKGIIKTKKPTPKKPTVKKVVKKSVKK